MNNPNNIDFTPLILLLLGFFSRPSFDSTISTLTNRSLSNNKSETQNSTNSRNNNSLHNWILAQVSRHPMLVLGLLPVSGILALLFKNNQQLTAIASNSNNMSTSIDQQLTAIASNSNNMSTSIDNAATQVTNSIQLMNQSLTNLNTNVVGLNSFSTTVNQFLAQFKTTNEAFQHLVSNMSNMQNQMMNTNIPVNPTGSVRRSQGSSSAPLSSRSLDQIEDLRVKFTEPFLALVGEGKSVMDIQEILAKYNKVLEKTSCKEWKDFYPHHEDYDDDGNYKGPRNANPIYHASQPLSSAHNLLIVDNNYCHPQKIELSIRITKIINKKIADSAKLELPSILSLPDDKKSNGILIDVQSDTIRADYGPPCLGNQNGFGGPGGPDDPGGGLGTFIEGGNWLNSQYTPLGSWFTEAKYSQSVDIPNGICHFKKPLEAIFLPLKKTSPLPIGGSETVFPFLLPTIQILDQSVIRNGNPVLAAAWLPLNAALNTVELGILVLLLSCITNLIIQGIGPLKRSIETVAIYLDKPMKLGLFTYIVSIGDGTIFLRTVSLLMISEAVTNKPIEIGFYEAVSEIYLDDELDPWDLI